MGVAHWFRKTSRISSNEATPVSPMRLIVIDDATPARKALSSNENPMVLAKVKAAFVASPAPQTSIGGVTGIGGISFTWRFSPESISKRREPLLPRVISAERLFFWTSHSPARRIRFRSSSKSLLNVVSKRSFPLWAAS